VKVQAVPTVLVVQEKHPQWTLYYPFGMGMRGLDWTLNPNRENKYQYNGGVEKNTDFDLNWYETFYRDYDQQTSRFVQVDPKAEAGGQESLSPYQYSFNNPIRYNDPKGDEPPQKPWYEKVANWVSNTLKGINAGTNQRYIIEPKQGATVTGIRDSEGGRIKNGKPVGIDVVRIDKPHGKVKTPHINVNEAVTGVKDPHTPISNTALKSLGSTGKTLYIISKVAKPLAILTDAVRIGAAVNADGGVIGDNAMTTTASVAGGWAGAWGGATLGAKGGAVVGSFFGPGPGTAVGGFVGGIGGGLIGAFGGSWLSEKAVETVIEKK
jgi:RHS repeat-associated protein